MLLFQRPGDLPSYPEDRITLGEEREARGALEAGQALPTSFSWDVPEVSPYKMPFQAQRKLVNKTAGYIWPLRKTFKAWVRSKVEMWF